MEVPPLESDANALLMRDSPPVLTVGGRQTHGFGFVWLPNCSPCWITPKGKVIPLDVANNIPFLNANGKHTKSLNDQALSKLVGLPVKKGRVSGTFCNAYGWKFPQHPGGGAPAVESSTELATPVGDAGDDDLFPVSPTTESLLTVLPTERPLELSLIHI